GQLCTGSSGGLTFRLREELFHIQSWQLFVKQSSTSWSLTLCDTAQRAHIESA
ncbi:hypothetical protein NQZ68_029305, partial [Dissostichus eleginoides]